MTQTATVKAHVAGPVEREHADNPAGWRWAQKCLRCDASLLDRRPSNRERAIVADAEKTNILGSALTGAKAGELVEVQLGSTFAGGFYRLGAVLYEDDEGGIAPNLWERDTARDCEPEP